MIKLVFSSICLCLLTKMEIKVTNMWYFKTAKLSVVIGALGVVAKAAPYYVFQTPRAPL